MKNNVVSIFSKKPVVETETKETQANIEEKTLSFEEIAAQNAANKERLAKERALANKGVLKSYRIK